MKFENAFELPLTPASAWPLLLDVPRIAPCMPDAKLTEIESDGSYKGKVVVRLGPVALAFAGRAVIEGIDCQNYTARINAQGVDQKGRGGANASVTFRLEPTARGSKVVILTALTLSGSVAQYGRGAGIIREVAAELTAEFARSLRQQLATSSQSMQETAAEFSQAAAQHQESAPVFGLSLLLRALCATVRAAIRPRSSSDPRRSEAS